MKSNRIISLLLVFLISVFGSCEDNLQFNPCENKEPFTVDFSMGESMRLFTDSKYDTIVASDTVLSQNLIVFEASDIYRSYEWSIGDDPRVFNTKRVQLIFETDQSNLRVKLTAKSKASNSCFLDDDGIDTKIKYLTVIKRAENPIFGEYNGSIDSAPDDDFKIQVTHDDYFDQINILNINKNCYPIDESIGLRGLSTSMGYKKLRFFSGFYYKSCNDPEGWFILSNSNKEALVAYSIGDGSETTGTKRRIKQNYKGTKVN